MLVVDEAVLLILVNNAPLPHARHKVSHAVVPFDTKFIFVNGRQFNTLAFEKMICFNLLDSHCLAHLLWVEICVLVIKARAGYDIHGV